MSGLPIAQGLSGSNAQVRWDGPTTVVAGLPGTWTATIHARRAAWRAGTRIAFVWRWPSDWDIPQCGHPAAPGYTQLHTSAPCGLRWRTYRCIEWHPFDHVFEVELLDVLAADEHLCVVFGDTRQGSPGMRTQTFYEDASKVSIRLHTVDQDWCEVGLLQLAVVADKASAWSLIAPSDVVCGDVFELVLRVEDAWCNPATLPAPPRIDGTSWLEPAGHSPGRMVWRARLDTPGIHRLSVSGELPATQANPTQAHAAAPQTKIHWGDIHGQSLVGCGARSVSDYFEHARDFACLDFSSHQANCFLVSADEWAETEAVTRRFHQNGRFVTLLGLEWSANTDKGGDRNLYFSGDTAPITRCSHEYVIDRSDAASDLPTARELHRHYDGSDTLVALHVGGRTTDLSQHHPALERLIEIHSTHATSEWFFLESLARGYRMGVIAGSDGVDGRPGTSHPGRQSVRNVRSGLVAVPLPALDRPSLLQALRDRHCYATTGARIRLSFCAGEHSMGSEFHARTAPVLSFQVDGTTALERIDLFRNTTPIESVNLMAAAGAASDTLRIAWRGATWPGNFSKARMVWDGHATLSSGSFSSVHAYAMDTPDEGVTSWGPQAIHWRSRTGGDWDGVVAHVQAPADAIICVNTPQISTSMAWSHIGTEAITIADTEPNRALEICRLAAQEPPLSFQCEWRDRSWVAGWNAYWVRVRQSDGQLAWSSPIFVHFDAGATRSAA